MTSTPAVHEFALGTLDPGSFGLHSPGGFYKVRRPMPFALNQEAADVSPLALLPRHIRADSRLLPRISSFGRVGLVFFLLLWSFRLLAAVPDPAPLPQPRTARLYGQDYVHLNRWAEEREFKLVWPARSDDIHLTNRWAALTFKVDSRRAEINGVAVWLSYAVAARNGSAFIAWVDVKNVIYPVLYPPKNLRKTALRTVVLDPGHGGKDPGNGEGTGPEKFHTLLLAKEIRALLEKARLNVVLTRTTDKFVDLDQRSVIAKKNRADLYISLHYNAAPHEAGARGVEIYCLPPSGTPSASGNSGDAGRDYLGNRNNVRNMLLAFQVQKSIVRSLNVEDRGVRHARYAVLKNADMPAILIEGGFMSDPAEAKRIENPSHRRKLAQAIVDGILAYKRLVER
jgi:N-acetylmuramoyl-L-alanine amidase